jgi:hypothetical protein
MISSARERHPTLFPRRIDDQPIKIRIIHQRAPITLALGAKTSERIESNVNATFACGLVKVGADAILKVAARSPAVTVIVIAGTTLLDGIAVVDELLPAFAKIQVVSGA